MSSKVIKTMDKPHKFNSSQYKDCYRKTRRGLFGKNGYHACKARLAKQEKADAGQ